MSFVQRELASIQRAMRDPAHSNRYAELYAAQQALSWAIEPAGFAPASKMITGIQASLEDCSAHLHPQPSLDICSRADS